MTGWKVCGPPPPLAFDRLGSRVKPLPRF